MKQSRCHKCGRLLVIVFLLALVGPGAFAESYPNRPIRLIVPFAAGGLNDVVARLVPLLFLVTPKVPAHSLVEFVALAKANPGKFNYASPGAATQTHLIVELFSQKAGIKLQHIPYRGGSPTMTAMVAGDTQFTAISTLLSLPQIQAGALRAIATGGLEREPQLPDVPTVVEQGYPGFEAIQWIGLLTTAGTPGEIIARLNTELNRALRDPDLIARFAQQGLAPAGGSPAEFQATIANDLKNFTAIARAANIKAE